MANHDQVIVRLIRRMSKRDTIQRGAMARVAEALGVPRGTVHRWIYTDTSPTIHHIRAIERLLKVRDFDFSARKAHHKAFSA